MVQAEASGKNIRKWLLACLLVGISAAIFWWPAPAVKVELLPFTDSPPPWDGSYPNLVISLVPGKGGFEVHSSIDLKQPTLQHQAPVNEFDVDLHTGRFVLRQTDLFVPDVVPLSLTRTYIAWDHHSRAFGVGGNHPYDIAPTGTRFPYTYQDLNLEDGYQVHMPRISKGTGYADAVFRHSDTSSEFYGAQDAWNGNGWTLTLRDGSRVYFPEAYHAKSLAQGAATEIVDAQGRHLELKRDSARNLKELISPGGRRITLQYDSSDRIIEARSDAGEVRRYSYDSNGHLDAVADSSGVLYRFEYAPLLNEAGFDPWLLTAVFDRHQRVLLHNKYLWGRIAEQQLFNGETYSYSYDLKGVEVQRCTVTLASGEKKLFAFPDGKPTP